MATKRIPGLSETINKLQLAFLKILARVPEFDSEFYRVRYYNKIAHSPEENLIKHYIKYGRRQGLHPNPSAFVQDLTERFGQLPPDFSPIEYSLANADLQHFEDPLDLIEHYLVFGRGENRPLRIEPSSIVGFDADFYRKYYQDQFDFGPEDDLRIHFVTTGVKQGLFPNAQAFVKSLEEIHGRLPEDFSPSGYLHLNKDLWILPNEWKLIEHYLFFGRSEKRRYKIDKQSIESEYQEFINSPLLQMIFPRDNFFPETFSELLAASGLKNDNWISKFNLYEFRILNTHWLPEKSFSRMGGLCLFIKAGIEVLAPIAMNEEFDPSFYRQNANIVDSETSDSNLYRDWLNRGLNSGIESNEKAALIKLLGVSRFPVCFHYEEYIDSMKKNGGVSLNGRFHALADYTMRGFTRFGTQFLKGSDIPILLQSIGNFHLVRGNFHDAMKAFDSALLELPTSKLYHLKGECFAALDDNKAAAINFELACTLPDSNINSHIKALEYFLKSSDCLSAALGRLIMSAPACYGSPTWRAMAFSVIDKQFESIRERALGLYKDGRRDEGDAVFNDTLPEIIELMNRIDPLPGRVTQRRNGRVLLIANRDLPQCDYYRVQQRSIQLRSGGWLVEIVDQNDLLWSLSEIDRASAVIFYRVSASPKVIRAILYAKALGALTYYDIDDLIFDSRYYPEPFDTYEGLIDHDEYSRLQMGVPLFKFAMGLCEIGLTSTSTLVPFIAKTVTSGECYIIRNGFDFRNDPFLSGKRIPFSNAQPTIFYGSGTKAHSSDFTNVLAPALIKILSEYPNVRLMVAGFVPLDRRFSPFRNRIISLDFSCDLNSYWEVLSGSDISVSILSDNIFTDAKSEIKWLEAAMCGIPSILSPTATYRDVLVDGETCIFAYTPEDWLKAFRYVLKHPDRAIEVGAQAKKFAVENYSVPAAVESLKKILPAAISAGEEIIDSSGHSRHLSRFSVPELSRVWSSSGQVTARRRVLIVNVYFPPHTFGGATRVVRENVDYLIDNMSDEFEVAILSTDHNSSDVYRTRVDSYRGVPVFRIATPIEEHMDWRPFDVCIEAPFETLLEQFCPDLIHFHCIQRLTGSIVEIAYKKGINYMVTCHDAWWISDYQFLLNEDGEVCRPSPDPFSGKSRNTYDRMASISRSRRLSRLLNAASQVLCVSDRFSEIYRQAGVENAKSLPNGIPSLKSRYPRVKSKNGRVRLGHIGGRTTHKGATLVEVILKNSNFANIELLLVDHSLNQGEHIIEKWGETLVNIIGFVPQDDIVELYARLDVLLAPSLWPESFGLVTREAMACGLWVIASDRGAIGEDVVPGVNGFVVDVSDAKSLTDVLIDVNKHPERFLASPITTSVAKRSSSTQSLEICNLYRDESRR